MQHQPAIFIFTKDRPPTLKKTLDSINTVQYTKYVVDDSISPSNQNEVSELCKLYENIKYLGKKEFIFFTALHKINLKKFSFLLQEPGHNGWNLGYARNFALIIAKSLALDRILFMDDDIYVEKPELIDALFNLLSLHAFSGANIKGLIDDSILGHIATDLGIENERMLSGGFMAFNPNKIDHFFFNNYNEDWIWLFLQLKGKTYLQFGEVYQELSNPLKNYEEKIMFQEFGEISLDGVMDLYKIGEYNTLKQLQFWDRLLNERENYLSMLYEKVKHGNRTNDAEIIQLARKHSSNFTAETFTNLYAQYYEQRESFLKLYKTL